MIDEKKTCDTCRFFDVEEGEEPCESCRNNKIPFSDEYDDSELLWKPIDNVNYPAHYTQGNIECIDAMVAAFGEEAVMNFCLCNAFKYIWRARHKNGVEDLDKAKWYIDKYKELANDSDNKWLSV